MGQIRAPAPLLAIERVAAGGGLLCLFNLGPTPVRYPTTSAVVRFAHGDAKLAGGEALLGGYAAMLIDR